MTDNFSGGAPSISIEDAIEIAELCMVAGAPDRISDFFACRFTPEDVKARLSAPPAAASAAAKPAARPSIFGGPTPEQRDQLAAVLERRFRAMYPPASKVSA
ncbi:hypothetical protein SAMN02990966_06935 [Rhodospirillales bacterium URHD0017]|nr:hypothetical protein SAMN02990966_06935 [Rhodospirillales bacterium URHD0017]